MRHSPAVLAARRSFRDVVLPGQDAPTMIRLQHWITISCARGGGSMKPDALAERLTLGCRILAEQEIIDGFGHLSARMPGEDELFMINRHMSPALVEPDCFIVMDVDGNVVSGDGHPNNEWPIHARIYAARP